MASLVPMADICCKVLAMTLQVPVGVGQLGVNRISRLKEFNVTFINAWQ